MPFGLGEWKEVDCEEGRGLKRFQAGVSLIPGNAPWVRCARRLDMLVQVNFLFLLNLIFMCNMYFC